MTQENKKARGIVNNTGMAKDAVTSAQDEKVLNKNNFTNRIRTKRYSFLCSCIHSAFLIMPYTGQDEMWELTGI
jgi:hypothetical protein